MTDFLDESADNSLTSIYCTERTIGTTFEKQELSADTKKVLYTITGIQELKQNVLKGYKLFIVIDVDLLSKNVFLRVILISKTHRLWSWAC